MRRKRTTIIISVVFLILALCRFTDVLNSVVPSQMKSSLYYKVIGHRKVSLEEAEKLVRAHIFEEMPEMNPNAEFPLAEITRNGVWEKLHAQIFVCLGEIRTRNCYLIRDGLVDTLGEFVTKLDSSSFCVTDLDKNGKSELIYTYLWGSGVPRSDIYVYIEHNKLLHSDMGGFIAHDFFLEKQGRDEVLVKARRCFAIDDEKVLIGRVTLEKVGGELKLLYHEDKNIPYTMKQYYMDFLRKN